MTATWPLTLPYRTPPLTLNKRLHHMAEYRVKEALKADAFLLAKSLGIPRLQAVTAELVWFKADNRRADSDNIAPTMKPCLDGLVAAGVLPDDDSRHVLQTSTRVVLRSEHGHDGGHVVLYVHASNADSPEATHA